MTNLATRSFLGGAGALLGYVGGAILLNPRAFLSANGVDIGAEPSLISELKAPSGVLVLVAALMIFGAFRTRYANLGLMAGGVLYGSYGVVRVFSMIADGWPSTPLLIATALELALASILLGLRFRSTNPQYSNTGVAP
ncbi:MAG: DUF4345 domain-containing protein [Pseudomonadota bacterium]